MKLSIVNGRVQLPSGADFPWFGYCYAKEENNQIILSKTPLPLSMDEKRLIATRLVAGIPYQYIYSQMDTTVTVTVRKAGHIKVGIATAAPQDEFYLVVGLAIAYLRAIKNTDCAEYRDLIS